MTQVNPGMFAGLLMQGFEQGQRSAAQRRAAAFADRAYADQMGQQEADNQYRQEQTQRRTFESDRNYERGVTESNRVFDRRVYEDDRDATRQTEQDNLNFQQGAVNDAMRAAQFGMDFDRFTQQQQQMAQQEAEEQQLGEVMRDMNRQALAKRRAQNQNPQGSMLVPDMGSDPTDPLNMAIENANPRVQRAIGEVLKDSNKAAAWERLMGSKDIQTSLVADPSLRMALEFAREMDRPEMAAQLVMQKARQQAKPGGPIDPVADPERFKAAVLERAMALRAAYPNADPSVLVGVAEREVMGGRVDMPEVSVGGTTRGNPSGARAVYQQLAAQYRSLNGDSDAPPTRQEMELASKPQPAATWGSDYHDEYPAIKAKVDAWQALQTVQRQLMNGAASGGSMPPASPIEESIDDMIRRGATDDEIAEALGGAQ
jgi:hypothetical protein